MSIKSNLPYPKDDYVQLLKDFYADINGADSFEPVKNWQADKWSATVHCSRGEVLEKAGFSRVHLVGGVIGENPGDINLFETIAYPLNPKNLWRQPALWAPQTGRSSSSTCCPI